jgi:hypothetical protein
MQPWKTKSRKTILEQRPWLVAGNHSDRVLENAV